MMAKADGALSFSIWGLYLPSSRSVEILLRFWSWFLPQVGKPRKKSDPEFPPDRSNLPRRTGRYLTRAPPCPNTIGIAPTLSWLCNPHAKQFCGAKTLIFPAAQGVLTLM